MTAPQTYPDTSVLDNAMWESLIGPHAQFSEGTDLVRRYLPTVAPMIGIGDVDDPRAWTDLAALVGPEQEVAISHSGVVAPAGWTPVMGGLGVQMVATDRLRPRPFEEAVRLGAADVDDMLALIARTQPGPFLPETYRLGTYLGVRREGRLIAMAGERLHPPGWTEISAVCTDEEFRGQGLGSRLVLAVADGIHARGETPFLHAAASNVNAIELYKHLGFVIRTEITFTVLRSPAT
ncbi:GNAT family N-acetyltransferase [Gordonia sp. KTR9]|uniref:GNAT family N-acetyltransferase n=1 Tax=Gordonia sp. KTR9 TaxID=337191 RepID=UPI00027DDE18|nr:GNAT family N-acetyltransferase [Gordonia sp. KTR9]AFR47274.1 putative acetyltransferase [Gordonia sp. KTR9]